MGVLIEDCFVLNSASLRKIFGRARRREEKIDGQIAIYCGERKEEAGFWVEYAEEEIYIFVAARSHEPQQVLLADLGLTFGIRTYFRCECGAMASKLYLPPGREEFRCRRCHGLRYKLTTFNRNSLSGEFQYRVARAEKLDAEREAMKRIIYGRHYTKKFLKYLEGCRKIGFGQIADSAKSAMEVMRAVKPIVNNFR